MQDTINKIYTRILDRIELFNSDLRRKLQHDIYSLVEQELKRAKNMQLIEVEFDTSSIPTSHT